MVKRFFNFLFKHKIITIIVVIVALTGGYFAYASLGAKTSETRYVLAAVEKGTIVSTVSGSGQISASDQIDLKPEVLGDVVYVSVKTGQEVKKGQLLVQVDDIDAKKAVSDAEIALESAKTKLEDLTSIQSLFKAENTLAQAERNLEKAEEIYKTIGTDTQTAISESYDDGYSAISTAFYELSNCIEDLKSVSGTDNSSDEYIGGYKLILGSNSSFIQRFVDDYKIADDSFDKNFASFKVLYRDSDKDTIYQTIINTHNTAKLISTALESARHMYDAIIVNDYSRLNIATQINKMQPIVESDISSVLSTVNSLSQAQDNIDSAVEDAPGKVKDAEITLNSAKETYNDAKSNLDDLKKGNDSLDVRTQQNVVAQKELDLETTKSNLASCYARAPFDGTIAEVNVEKGDSVSSGTNLVSIITKQKIAEITLNEIDIAKVKLGQKATITLDAIDGFSITGEVTEIDTVGTVTQGVVNYSVKINFDTQDDRVKPGMSTSVIIMVDSRQNVLTVSNSAIKSQADGTYYVEIPDSSSTNNFKNQISSSGIVLSSLPNKKTVEIGLEDDSNTEITSGLNEGDIVIVRTITSSTSSSSTSSSSTKSNTNIFQSFGGAGGPPSR